MSDISTEIALELALLQREALERVRERNAKQQLGEAWVDMEKEDPRKSEPTR